MKTYHLIADGSLIAMGIDDERRTSGVVDGIEQPSVRAILSALDSHKRSTNFPHAVYRISRYSDIESLEFEVVVSKDGKRFSAGEERNLLADPACETLPGVFYATDLNAWYEGALASLECEAEIPEWDTDDYNINVCLEDVAKTAVELGAWRGEKVDWYSAADEILEESPWKRDNGTEASLRKPWTRR
jgi:hypothetical protein